MRVFMKNIILVIGEEIRYDAALMSYISRSYERVFGRMDDLKFLSENDKVLPFALEKMIDSYDFITIFAANSAYAVVGKILFSAWPMWRCPLAYGGPSWILKLTLAPLRLAFIFS